MMTEQPKIKKRQKPPEESGIEYRATIRFPRKDYEFMQKLIEEGEYTNITEIVRDAVKKFRLEWVDMELSRNFMPMGPMMNMRMMPKMRRMMRAMWDEDYDEKEKK